MRKMQESHNPDSDSQSLSGIDRPIIKTLVIVLVIFVVIGGFFVLSNFFDTVNPSVIIF